MRRDFTLGAVLALGLFADDDQVQVVVAGAVTRQAVHMHHEVKTCSSFSSLAMFCTSLSSGPTPSPGTMVTLKVASARAGGASGPQRAADTLSGREASSCHWGPLRP
ncbi:hypothetical protein F7725_016755 [Dissostichus mawsoni]|uniref:Secreted protein n=1 Tax=Dissostichus mawsoni TaxID=36200 RepID=A0A7J5Z2G4_DISMA|nr:hypothetical protein F7725_016755 [Dissostichus mawsoni]